MSRAPITLSREMKIGLIALLMLALLGGWLLMNNRQAATVDTAPVTTTTPAQGGKDTNPPAPADQGAQEGTPPTTPGTSIPAAPSTTTDETVTAPPFPVTDANGSTPDPTVPTPVPSGINPDTPLLGLNGHNPFRPNKLEVSDIAQSSAITASQPNAGASNDPVTITSPSSSASQIDDALATSGSGVVPVSPIPTGTNDMPGGVIPVSPPPGTTASVPTPTIPSRTGSSGAAPSRTTASNVPSSTVTIPSGGNTSMGNATAQPTTPPLPPITAVREPMVSVPGTPNQAASAQGTRPGTGLGNTASGSLAQPAEPQAITDAGANPNTHTASTPSGTQQALEAYVKNHQLVFDAAVLGPVNTAIFRSEKGFIVATSGQPLPDSKIILKEVTATTATLALEQSNVTLQLDNR